MHERNDLNAINLDDIPGIVRQISAASRSGAAIIMIGSFKFSCDTMTGDVKNIMHQQGSINYSVGSESIGKYEYQIQRALEIAAKIDLIEQIKSLDDKKLNYVIAANAIDLNYPTEQTVNLALNKIFAEVKLSLITKFGLMAPKQTEKQKAVNAALEKVGLNNISTYYHADQIMAEARARLTHAEPKQPTPKMTG